MARHVSVYLAFSLLFLCIGAMRCFAQSTYVTPAGSRVAGVVTLACDTNGTNCAPIPSDANGLVTQFAPVSRTWVYAAPVGGITNSSAGVTVAPAVAGSRNYIMASQCFSDPLGASTEFVIRNGASGTVLWRSKLSTSGTPMGIQVIYSPPLRGSVNTLVEIATLTPSVTGSVYCNLQGYTGTQ